MNFLDKLERKYGKYAIRNLMSYIVLGNGIIFLLVRLGIAPASTFLFHWDSILNGEWWRLITFIFIPETTSLIWIIFTVMMYYFVGNALEQVWGSFKFNMYYLTGVIGTMIVASIFGIPASATYVNLSLFLGFATMFPDMEFLLYFFIPIKAKYMAIFYFVILGFDIINSGMMTFILVLVSLLNYFLFFGMPALKRLNRKRKGVAVQKNYRSYNKNNIPKGSKDPIKVAFHKCHVCGITEVDHPDMEFRYCSKCNGHYEYCMDHLKDHEHVE